MALIKSLSLNLAIVLSIILGKTKKELVYLCFSSSLSFIIRFVKVEGILILETKLEEVTVRWGKLRTFLLHTTSLILIVFPAYAIFITLEEISPPNGFLDLFFIYGAILCIILFPIQLGLQFGALSLRETPPLLLAYYFQHEAKLPHEVLDPIKSRIGAVSLLGLLLGGYVAWPLYTILGMVIVFVHFWRGDPSPLEIEQIIRRFLKAIPPAFLAYLFFTAFAIAFIQWGRGKIKR